MAKASILLFGVILLSDTFSMFSYGEEVAYFGEIEVNNLGGVGPDKEKEEVLKFTNTLPSFLPNTDFTCRLNLVDDSSSYKINLKDVKNGYRSTKRRSYPNVMHIQFPYLTTPIEIECSFDNGNAEIASKLLSTVGFLDLDHGKNRIYEVLRFCPDDSCEQATVFSEDSIRRDEDTASSCCTFTARESEGLKLSNDVTNMDAVKAGNFLSGFENEENRLNDKAGWIIAKFTGNKIKFTIDKSVTEISKPINQIKWNRPYRSIFMVVKAEYIQEEEEEEMGTVTNSMVLEGLTLETFDEEAFATSIAETMSINRSLVNVSVEETGTNNRRQLSRTLREDDFGLIVTTSFPARKQRMLDTLKELQDSIDSGEFLETLKKNNDEEIAEFITITDSFSSLGKLFRCDDNQQIIRDEQFLTLTTSSHNELCTLTTTDDQDFFYFLGRSYDGSDWQSVVSLPLEYKCSNILNETRCTVAIPPDTPVVLKKYTIEEKSDDVFASRFLSQTTFGPTRIEIEELAKEISTANKSKAVQDWLAKQMSLQPSLHREYYRKRANLRVNVPVMPGRPRLACEVNSRWHRFAFETNDIGKTIEAKFLSGNKVSLIVDGFARTTVDISILNESLAETESPLVICQVGESVDGLLKIGKSCFDIKNPAIEFDSPPVRTIQNIQLKELNPPVKSVKLLESPPENCYMDPLGPVFAQYENAYWLLDPRLVTRTNLIDQSNASSRPGFGYGQGCPDAPKTFLNEESCVVGTNVCSSTRYSSSFFKFDDNSIRDFYLEGQRYVYEIRNLPLEKSTKFTNPCQAYTKSRWKIVSDCSDKSNGKIDSQVEAVLINLLNNTDDPNKLLKDIYISWHDRCSGSSIPNSGIKLEVDSTCYKHVHPDLHNVYDFTFWSEPNGHPGNYKMQNPITQPAILGQSFIEFPTSHSIDHDWNIHRPNKNVILLGRLGDVIDFAQLPPSLQIESLAKKLGSSFSTPLAGESCGSPGEVETEPTLGSRLGLAVMYPNDVDLNEGTYDAPITSPSLKGAVWTSVSLYAKDQLRQRIAWAFSQILVVNVVQVDMPKTTELFLTFYDILVRNAFTNYFQLLKEVAYSPAMGHMLTYIGSSSMSYNYWRFKKHAPPDENFAREVMQLFTIGLWEMNVDGTYKTDENNLPVDTYTNKDIQDFARAWTGFTFQPMRGNIESIWGMFSANKIDPMKIDGARRDRFPKMGLGGSYIGDRTPLCVDLPSKAFLRKGAKFRYLGNSPMPDLQPESEELNEGNSNVLRIVLNENSELYSKLSSLNKSTVILDSNLRCHGIECRVDRIKVVKVFYGNNPCADISASRNEFYDYESHPKDNSHGDVCRQGVSIADDSYECPTGCSATIDGKAPFCLSPSGSPCRLDVKVAYYEYIRPSCVEFVYFNNATKVQGFNTRDALCADPRLPVAGESCCDSNKIAQNLCSYSGEYVTFESNENRCNSYDTSKELCDFIFLQRPFQAPSCYPGVTQFWTPEPCQLKVKVRSDGQIAVVHIPPQGPTTQDVMAYMRESLKPESKHWIRVLFKNNEYPKAPNCGSMCELFQGDDGDFCLCSINVNEIAVFSSMPTRKDALQNLFIGSYDPKFLDDYSLLSQTDTIEAYSRTGEIDENTIFCLEDENRVKIFLKNMRSEVHFGTFSFRNPPTFHSLVNQGTERDAQYETDAVINHIIKHPNTAPFLATRLIQRLVTSNPSPRYVEAVAKAFRVGKHNAFGTGEYGDLSATFAAILLDPEARSLSVQLDPAAGKIREPLLKVMNFMRSMEMVPKPGYEVDLYDLHTRIGQMAYQAPNVFSFFHPDFSPKGPLSDSNIAAPEAQAMDAPWIISLLNGLYSLARYGLSNCFEGFGRHWLYPKCWRIQRGWDDPDDTNLATLQYSPFSNMSEVDIVTELDLLLTEGRMSVESRNIIAREYSLELSASKDEKRALNLAQQLVVSSLEFHTTSVNKKSEKPRNVAIKKKGTHPYKAIVYVLLEGGMDSFNMLAPISNCEENKDMFAEYTQARGTAALPKHDFKEISTSTSDQVCAKFGLHKNLVGLRDMYNDGDATLIANVGVLVEPVTKETLKSSRLPLNLFAHNTQQRSAQTLYPQQASGATGVLGRIMDVLNRDQSGFSTGSFATDNGNNILVHRPDVSPPVTAVNPYRADFPTLMPDTLSDRFFPAYENLTKPTNNLLSEHWGSSTDESVRRSTELKDAVKDIKLTTTFSHPHIERQFQKVATLIKANSKLETDRDVFYVRMGGFDTHGDLHTFPRLLTEVDQALKKFANEMKDQNNWDNVAVILGSDFGRALPGNGRGTDHGWGGNSVIIGGGVNGGKIVGKYPADLSAESPNSVNNAGRVIPTTPWDSVFHSIALWMGVEPENMHKVLPNKDNFPKLFSKEDLFQ